MELELIVGGTLPVITSNFDALKKAIAERLENYKIQVTEDNLAQAKKDATELGKAATQLNKMKTDKVKEFSAPVDLFKAQVMELVGMIQEGQEFIKKQVAVFEDKTRKKCLEEMTACLKGNYILLGVRVDHQQGFQRLPDMVGISKVQKSGELTKAAKDAVMAIAQSDRGTQDLVDGRISRLEAECFKAGLKTSLQKDHIKHFLFAPDSVYLESLAGMIKIEVERQEKTLQAERERMEKEAKEKAEKEAREKMEKEKREEAAKVPPVQAPAAPAVTPPPAPVLPPVPEFRFPGQKQRLVVVVRFPIESEKNIEEMGSTIQYFEDALNRYKQNFPSAPLPAHTIKIEKDGN